MQSHVNANGLRIAVDDQGPRGAPALLMIMGLGMQLIAWPQGLVEALTARDLRVVRFDNRDIGLSYIFISHDLAVVRFISDEVLVMQHGDVVEQAGTAELLAAPKQDYTRRLLGAVPRGYQGAAPSAG